MIKTLGIIFLSVMGLQKSHASEKAFFHDHARGWFWYEDPDLLLLEEKPKEEPKSSAPPFKPKSAKERLKEVQENLLESKAKAILEPTLENVKAYQEMQMKVVNQSALFQQAWVQNVYLNPSLDENIKNPSAQAARFVVYDNERKEMEETIKSLKETYGLFYFYSGSCSFCKAFAPILKQFADKYGWQVMAISIDGEPSEVFSHWQMDNGLSQKWDVQTVPCVFAINPDSGHVIPVAHGFTALDVMEKRILTLVKGNLS